MLKLKDGAIRRLREQKCWSQEELARRAGVSVRTLQRAESGTTAKMDTVAFLAEALQVPPTDLMEEAPQPDAQPAPEAAPKHAVPESPPIPVVLHQVTTGKRLLDVAQGSMAMLPEARGVTDQADADAIGAIFDGLRDYLDASSDMSITDQLRYGVDLTGQIVELQKRGWWVLAGQKRHSLRSAQMDKPMAWTTCVIVAARADDSIIVHREDGEPVALVALPRQFNFA